MQLLPFTEIRDLYKSFKKSLLFTLFDGFNFISERLKYETEKENSLFYFKMKVVRELRPLDIYFDLTGEEADTNMI